MATHFIPPSLTVLKIKLLAYFRDDLRACNKKTQLRKLCNIHQGRREHAQTLGVLRSKWHSHLKIRGIAMELQARGLVDCSAW